MRMGSVVKRLLTYRILLTWVSKVSKQDIMQQTQFQYQLKRYKTPSDRVTCPACGGKKSFAPYIDIETGNDLPAQYGRCNRIDQCGYHLNPYKDGYGTNQQKPDGFVPAPIAKPRPSKPAVDLPKVLLIATLKKSPDNRFIQHLLKLFPTDVVSNLQSEYMIGDHDVWSGATIFWFVNSACKVRAGQVKQFDNAGHTAKNSDGTSRTVWIHKLIPKETEWLAAYEDQDMRVDCLFGEHLLSRYPDRKIALFESPKTAIIAAPFFPEMLCLAVGALDYLTPERVQSLKGKTVILYPDLSKEGKAFAKWSEKAERLRHLGDFKVSSFLEQIATDEERAKGLDMADYLERMDYKPRPEELRTVSEDVTFGDVPAEPTPGLIDAEPVPHTKPEPFDIAEYREWISTKEMPKSKIILNDAVTIYNLEAFVTGRLNHIHAFTGRTDQGNRPQFIRQLKYIRKYFHTLQ
jgi:hypothetical protein